jgi:hypothetical protein
MEDVGIDYWQAVSGVTVTKETPGHSGDQCLRVTEDDGSEGYASQGTQNNGGLVYFGFPKGPQYGDPSDRYAKIALLSLWYRSDGNATPFAEIEGNTRFDLTTSTDWVQLVVSNILAATTSSGKFV